MTSHSSLSTSHIGAYLKRIGLDAKPFQDLTGLRQLQRSHLYAVPFENLDIHCSKEIKLEVPALYAKVVERKRGGFCYELNGLFHHLLLGLGFDSRMVNARVFAGAEKGYGPDFDHMALLVRLEGQEYLVDVGFGEFALEPLLFEVGHQQKDPRGTFVIHKERESYWRVDKVKDGAAAPEYLFENAARRLDDFGPMCDFQQHNPDSHFKRKKVISRPTPTGRITLNDRLLKITSESEAIETELPDEAAFQDQLEKHFGFRMD